MGITEEEYREFLEEGKKRKVRATGHSIAGKFVREGRVLRLEVGSQDSPLRKIRIDLQDHRLTASAGDIGLPKWDSSSSEDSPLGPWEGYKWNLERGDLDTFNIRIVELWVYRLRNSGKILWRLQDSEVVNRKMKYNFEFLFQHSPKDTQPGGPANRSQPIRSETNSTSSAAGSDR